MNQKTEDSRSGFNIQGLRSGYKIQIKKTIIRLKKISHSDGWGNEWSQ